MKDTKIICFEGGDMSGKTTGINWLKDKLESEGFSVYVTREPGGCEVAEEIRATLLNNRENTNAFDGKVEELLFLAARRAHLLDKLIPLKNSGEYDYILLDRFILSSAVYQGFASNEDLANDQRIENMDRVIKLNLDYITFNEKPFLPDLFIVLDIDPAIAMTRPRSDGDRNRIDNKSIDYHNRVRRGYLFAFENLDIYYGKIMNHRLINSGLEIDKYKALIEDIAKFI